MRMSVAIWQSHILHAAWTGKMVQGKGPLGDGVHADADV